MRKGKRKTVYFVWYQLGEGGIWYQKWINNLIHECQTSMNVCKVLFYTHMKNVSPWFYFSALKQKKKEKKKVKKPIMFIFNQLRRSYENSPCYVNWNEMEKEKKQFNFEPLFGFQNWLLLKTTWSGCSTLPGFRIMYFSKKYPLSNHCNVVTKRNKKKTD